MFRKMLCTALLTAAVLAGPLSVSAFACPSCKAGNETDPNRPRAYMYSILFMLGMPAVLFTAFGVGFYRLSRPRPFAGDESRTSDFSGH